MGGLFSCKEGRLRTLINMRANDTLPLLWYDLFEFSMLGEYIASYCGFDLGEYYHSSFIMMVIGRPAMDVAANLCDDTVESPVMAAMPTVRSETRPHLVRLERTIRNSVARVSSDEFRRLIDEIYAAEQPYWADLLTALAIQGRCVHIDRSKASGELAGLTIPDGSTVAHETIRNSLRILERTA
jgi:hypothetical protein